MTDIWCRKYFLLITLLFHTNHWISLRQPYPNLDRGVHLEHQNLIWRCQQFRNKNIGTHHWVPTSLNMSPVGHDTCTMMSTCMYYDHVLHGSGSLQFISRRSGGWSPQGKQRCMGERQAPQCWLTVAITSTPPLPPCPSTKVLGFMNLYYSIKLCRLCVSCSALTGGGCGSFCQMANRMDA